MPIQTMAPPFQECRQDGPQCPWRGAVVSQNETLGGEKRNLRSARNKESKSWQTTIRNCLDCARVTARNLSKYRAVGQSNLGDHMDKSHLKLISSASENRAVTLRRLTNKEMRPREYLTRGEIDRLIKAARGNRNGVRDSAMILTGYTHGLRVSELIGLQWSDVSFEDATLHIRRAKGGVTGSHPLRGDEKRVLRTLQRQAKGTWVFETERGGPFTVAGFASLIERAGEAAGIGFKVHAHMLRHSCGFAAINADVGVRDLQDFLGHKSISSTTRYAALASGRFKSIVERM